MSSPQIPRGLYFEGFQVGQRILTAARTITESDVVNFAGLSGDFNQIHTDAEFSKSTFYGQRIAHGLLCLSIAAGLAMRTGVLEGTAIAFREIREWKFLKPVFLGDTIHTELEVIETKIIPRLRAGDVTLAVTVINQKNEAFMKGTWLVLVMLQP